MNVATYSASLNVKPRILMHKVAVVSKEIKIINTDSVGMKVRIEPSLSDAKNVRAELLNIE